MAGPAYIDPDQVQSHLGDLQISSAIGLDSVAEDAADEMNVRLGERYVVPLNLASPSLLPHHKKLVEQINGRLAAGRLIMAVASPSEDRDLHNYGKYLVDLAMGDLDLIVSGRVLLGGQADSTVTTDPDAHAGPKVYNVDAESGVEQYVEAFFGGNYSNYWQPGPLP